MNKLKILIAFFGIFLFLSSPAFSEKKIEITGTYSDMCYDEAGDLDGMEVFLVSGADYYVYYQVSLGEPTDPILVKADVNEKMRTVDFVFPKESFFAGKKFHGLIEKDGMRVKIDNEDEEWLKRQPSYWENINRHCK